MDETATCKHCGEMIFKDPEGVLHKWRHMLRGTYLCFSNDHTQAEPEEQG